MTNEKAYIEKVIDEVKEWKIKVYKQPSVYGKLARSVQKKINRAIPEKFHETVTNAIRGMVKGVLTGSKYITPKPASEESFIKKEELVKKRFNYYKSSAVASGAGTGSGGFLLGLADFPILLSIKMKFLFAAASLYGFDVKDYKERVFILYIFQLAFSSADKRLETYGIIKDWKKYSLSLPDNFEQFDWRSFQQEYRDYIDLAKMLQLIPGFGAAFGAVANYRLMDKLYITATNCYRMRILE